jgi:hypothetical protein
VITGAHNYNHSHCHSFMFDVPFAHAHTCSANRTQPTVHGAVQISQSVRQVRARAWAVWVCWCAYITRHGALFLPLPWLITRPVVVIIINNSAHGFYGGALGDGRLLSPSSSHHASCSLNMHGHVHTSERHAHAPCCACHFI